VNDQVGQWTARVASKVAQQFGDYSLENKEATLLQRFKNISIIVHQQLRELQTNEE
jgi:CRISPR/Cas system CSM-associated protein Csm2 small subunit